MGVWSPSVPPTGEEPENRGGGGRSGPERPAFLRSARGGAPERAESLAPGPGRVQGGGPGRPHPSPPPPGERQALPSLRSHEPEPGPGASGGRGTGICLLPFPRPPVTPPGLAQAGASGSQAELRGPGRPRSLLCPGGQSPARPAEGVSGVAQAGARGPGAGHWAVAGGPAWGPAHPLRSLGLSPRFSSSQLSLTASALSALAGPPGLPQAPGPFPPPGQAEPLPGRELGAGPAVPFPESISAPGN